MPDYTITISTIEKKILEAWGINVQTWAENALLNKARKMADRTILLLSNINPKKLTDQEKVALLIELAAEHNITAGSLRTNEAIPEQGE